VQLILTKQPAQYHALTASQSPAFSAQTRTSQAYLPGPQSGYDGGHAAMALTGGAAQAGESVRVRVALAHCLHEPAQAAKPSSRTVWLILLPCTFLGLIFCLERLRPANKRGCSSPTAPLLHDRALLAISTCTSADWSAAAASQAHRERITAAAPVAACGQQQPANTAQ